MQQRNDATRQFLMATMLSRPAGELPGPCRLILTQEVDALPELERRQLFTKVFDFAEFTNGNDPHQEHDFGQVEVAGEKYFWKLDYYDRDLVYWQSPTDPKTTRVMTVMAASEY